jgi:hypothetical protein
LRERQKQIYHMTSEKTVLPVAEFWRIRLRAAGKSPSLLALIPPPLALFDDARIADIQL